MGRQAIVDHPSNRWISAEVGPAVCEVLRSVGGRDLARHLGSGMIGDGNFDDEGGPHLCDEADSARKPSRHQVRLSQRSPCDFRRSRHVDCEFDQGRRRVLTFRHVPTVDIVSDTGGVHQPDPPTTTDPAEQFGGPSSSFRVGGLPLTSRCAAGLPGRARQPRKFGSSAATGPDPAQLSTTAVS